MQLFDSEILESLRDLQTDDDPHFLKFFLQTLLDSLPPRFTAIQKALDSGDLKIIKIEAHALKSSFANAGVKAMSELCQKLELISDQKSLTQASELFKQLMAFYKLLLIEVVELPEFKGD